MNIPRPWEVALQAQTDVLRFAESPEGKRFFLYWLGDRKARYGTRATSPSAFAFTNSVRDLMMSEPFYISDEMQELVYSAMETFDRREPMTELDFFLKSGFAYLAEPFTTIDMNNLRISHRAIQWFVEDMTFSDIKNDDEYDRYMRERAGLRNDEGLLIEEKIEPGLRVILWANVNDRDDIPWNVDAAKVLGGSNWSVSHATTIPLSKISDTKETVGEGDMRAHWLTFLRVMQKLMAEKIVLRTRYKAHRTLRKQAGRVNLKIDDVTVVELRRRSQKSESENGGTREYSHQWVVRGFWRWQYYPASRTHKQKYIASHVRGPKDKPLIVKKRVWVWDR